MDTNSNKRQATSQAEIDFLPPYGKPEVDLRGEAATYFGLLLGVGALVYKVSQIK